MTDPKPIKTKSNSNLTKPQDPLSIRHWQEVYKKHSRLPKFVWDLYTPAQQVKYFGITFENANQSKFLNPILTRRTAYGDMTGGTDWVADNKKLQELSFKKKSLTREQYLNELGRIAYNINDPSLKYTDIRGSHPPVRPENINASQDAYNIFLGEPQTNNSWKISDYKPSIGKDDKSYYGLVDNSEIIDDLFKYNNSDFIKSNEKERFVKGSHVAQASLKNFKYSKGKDEKGSYVSYYDLNDYGNLLDTQGKPFEIYDRIYYDESTLQPINMKKKPGDKIPTKAKSGKTLKLDPKYFTYENLPCVGCKDHLMANFGMYIDPQPSIPKRAQIGSIDTNKVKLPPLPGISPRDLRPPKQERETQGPNFGDAALLTMSAFDALLPNPYSRQTVVQPQMAYNPIPYGTGSQALMRDGGIIPLADQGYYMGEDENNSPSAKDGKWIQKAINPKHKGYCTPMTKSTCTPRRKALAKTLKKMAKNRKKEEGGFITDGYDHYKKGGIIPDNMSVFNPHQYINGGNVNGGAKIKTVDAKYPNTDLLEQWLLYKDGGNVNGGAKLKEVSATYPNTDLMEQWLLYEHGGNVNGGAKLKEVGSTYPNSDLLEQWILYKDGGTLSASKAKEMLKDGTAHGKKLTKKQKQYFGMVAAGKAALGDQLTGDPTKPAGTANLQARRLRTGQIEQDALLADRVAELTAQGYDPFKAEGRNILNEVGKMLPDSNLSQELGVRLTSLRQDPTFSKLSPEQRIQRLYDSGTTGTTGLDDFLRRTKSLGGSPSAYYQGNPSSRTVPTLTFDKGGVLYNDGGSIDTIWGGNAELESYNPYDGGMVEFNGNSHAQGGIGMQFNGSPVEVEGGEYASRDAGGNLNIYGNMFIPGTKTKFKKAAKAIAGKEKRYDFLKNKGSELVNNANPANKFEQLKFNAGKVMMMGGDMGQADLADKKANLSSLQRAMLDMASEHGLDPFEMSKGKMKKAREGASIPFMQNGGDPGDGNDPSRADRNRNPGNIKYGPFAKKYGARKDKDGFAIFPNINSGLQAMKDLLKTKGYKDLSVKDAINRWTDGHPYRYDLGAIANKKVSSLTPEEFEKTINTMRIGEGTAYGVRPKPVPKTTPNVTPNVIDPGPFTPYELPNIPLLPPGDPVGKKTPKAPYDELEVPTRNPIPSNVEPLHLNQVLPEIFAAATNKVEPVPAQRYEPQLYTSYQVSFQDRLNANQSAFNAQMRAVGAGNPSAIGTLAAQKYQADQAVLGDEFRTNQAISNDITNKNIAVVNDANLKNLGIADTQMVRQSQARSNTRAQNQMILNSLSGKYAQNEFENKRLAAYENLYDYRFVPQEDGGLSATYFGPNAMFNYEGKNPSGKAQDIRTISRYDAQGNLKGYAEYDESELKTAQRLLDIMEKQRKMPAIPIQPLK